MLKIQELPSITGYVHPFVHKLGCLNSIVARWANKIIAVAGRTWMKLAQERLDLFKKCEFYLCRALGVIGL